MAGNTVRYSSRPPRAATNQRRYTIPGEVPSLPMQGYAQINPGLVEMPGMNWMAAAVNQDANAQAQTGKKLDALKAFKDLSSMAGDPGVNADIAGVADEMGYGGMANAFRRTKTPALPGQAPALPGGPTLPDEPTLLAEELGKMAESRPLDGKMVSDGMKKLFALRVANRQAYDTALARQQGEAVGMVNYETPAKINQERRLRPEKLATKQGESDIAVAGYGEKQDILTAQDKVRAKGRADVALDLKGDIAGVDLALHESKKDVDLRRDPQRAAAIESAKNPALAAREQDKSRARLAEDTSKSENYLERVRRELEARTADFEKRLTRTTKELGERAKQKGTGSGGKGAELAFKEATKFVDGLDLEMKDGVLTVKGTGKTPGEMLDGIYEQFAKVAAKASLSAKERALLDAVNGMAPDDGEDE